MVDTPSPPSRFVVVPERSAVLVEARSNVGKIAFGTSAIGGTIDVALADGSVELSEPPCAALEVRVDQLVSGNSLYDAELQRRLNARRFPTATLTLAHAATAGGPNRFEVRGPLTLHGVTRELSGTVEVTLPTPDRIVVAGDQVLDMRDFDLTAPGMLMLRIYPDVRVYLHLEGRREHRS